MSDVLVYPSQDGQEVQQGDVQSLGAVGGLADDRVIAEALRLAPFTSGSPSKAIMPYEIPYPGTGAASIGATVMPTGSANGSVLINPFRAVVGSRNTAAATPPAPNPAGNFQSNALANWRDVRSGVFVGSSSSLTLTQAFAANSSGNPRWDVVYAAITPDANGPSVTRRVKNPSTGVVSSVSVAQYLNSPVTIGVVAGAPGATPAVPNVPSDSGGNYYFALAAVRIPNGFSSGSTIATADIRSLLGSVGGAITQQWRSPRGQFDPGNGNNDGQGTYLSNFPWVAGTAGQRPGPFLPPDWVGGVVHKIVAFDFTTGGSFSHPNNSVVDDSMDWRNRIIVTIVNINDGQKFFCDNTGLTSRIPLASTADLTVPVSSNVTSNMQMSSTFSADGTVTASQASVLYLPHAYNALVGSGAQIGMFVDLTGLVVPGALLMQVSGSPACRGVAWIMASPQFPNM